MSEINHTAEPWMVAEKTQVRLDVAYLIRPVDDKNYDFGAALAATSERDARRIVACVNACAGIPNEDLQKVAGDTAPVFTLLMQYAKERDTAWQELREIREAIKANPEESTFDEAARIASEREELIELVSGAYNKQNSEYLTLLSKYAGTQFESDPAIQKLKTWVTKASALISKAEAK